MADENLPSPETLRNLLEYDPETGALTWKERGPEWFQDGHRTAEGNAANWNAKHAGKPAFTAGMANGYLCGRVKKKGLLAHRVAWAIHHGTWPVGEVDHINGDRRDNRIANLRNVSRSSNQRNTKRRATNTSGRTGVIFNIRKAKWFATIRGPIGRNVFLGYFDSFEEACAARASAERKYGYHENHGRVVDE